MTPLEQYQQQLIQGELQTNPDQQEVMVILNNIYHQLCQRQKKQNSFIGQLRTKIKPYPPITGLYVWGSVGAGKTHLVNLFYQCLPVKKMRQHFHGFMQMVHQQLTHYQGTKNPLQHIAKHIADHTILLVLDEFFVSNIADAMILGELLTALFNNGVCLVTTSNIEPQQLYLHGLQRERFLPVIGLIQQHTKIIALQLTQDYRLRSKQALQAYYTPLNAAANASLENCFINIAQSPVEITQHIWQLFNRNISVFKRADNIIWFDFIAICGRPRATKDFLEISKRYRHVIISNVPPLTTIPIDQLLSFIYLIDIFYDNHIRLIMSAATSISMLYPNGPLRQRFERTESRLIEMQSPDYLIHP